jgi:predicted nucleic acid-binding protein
MKRIHLDTNFLIHALQRGSREDQLLRAWLAADVSVGISAMAWAEFLCGPVGDADRDVARRLVGTPVPLDAGSAERAEAMFNDTGRRRGALGDCLIAATAVNAGAELATRNVAVFQRLSDARLVLADY